LKRNLPVGRCAVHSHRPVAGFSCSGCLEPHPMFKPDTSTASAPSSAPSAAMEIVTACAMRPRGVRG